MTIVGAIVTQSYRGIIHMIMPAVFYPITKGGDDEAERKKYTYKATEHFFRGTYFLASAVWGWTVLKDSHYLPTSLGGPSDADLMSFKLGDSIMQPASQALLQYSFYTWGFHLGNSIQHVLFEERGPEFAEMFIHHIAANSLYFAYIYGNAFLFGSIVAYLHDLADIPANLGKSFGSTTLGGLTGVIGVFLVSIWFWTRIYLLPQIIYFISQTKMDPSLERFSPFILLNMIFLGIMCVLHYYWFVLIVRMILRFATSGATDDL